MSFPRGSSIENVRPSLLFEWKSLEAEVAAIKTQHRGRFFPGPERENVAGRFVVVNATMPFLVNVTTDDAIEIMFEDFLGDARLEVAHVGASALDARFDGLAECNIGLAAPLTISIHESIYLNKTVVRRTTDFAEKWRAMTDTIEFVAVYDEKPTAVGRVMNGLAENLHATKLQAVVRPRCFVVIARNEQNTCAMLSHL